MGSPVNTISSRLLDNKIINGDMKVDQRREGAIVTNLSGNYSADRWRQDRTLSGSVDTSRSSLNPPDGFTHFLSLQTVNAVSVSANQFCEWLQPVEAFNITDTKFGTAAAQGLGLSFLVRSSVAGPASGAVRNHLGNRSYVFSFNIDVANTWEYKTISIPGDVGGTWNLTNQSLFGLVLCFCHSAGTDFRTTAGSWQNGTFVGVTGGNNITAVATSTYHLTGVQLNIGAPKPFQSRPFSEELLNCQRYYRKYPHLPAVATSTVNVSFYTSLIPEMRAPPLAGQTGLLNMQNGVVNTTQSGLSINTNFNSKDFVIGTAGLVSGLTLREPVHVGVPANNGNFVFFDAEF